VKYYKFILRIAISIVLLAFIFYKLNINIKTLFKIIVDYRYIFIAVIFPTVIIPFIVANRWKSFLTLVNIKENTFSLINITFQSTFLGLLLPSAQGYDAIRMYRIEKRHPQKRGMAGSTIIIERIIGLLCLCSVGIVASFFVPDTKIKWMIYIFSAAFILILFFLYNKQCYKLLHTLLDSVKYFKKVFGYLTNLHKETYSFPFDKTIIYSVLLILLLQLVNTFIIYLLFLSTGNHVSFSYNLLVYPLISIISMIPITFSGIGIRDGAFIFFYSRIGISADTIMCVSIINYMLIMLLPALLGSILYIFNTLKSKPKVINKDKFK